MPVIRTDEWVCGRLGILRNEKEFVMERKFRERDVCTQQPRPVPGPPLVWSLPLPLSGWTVSLTVETVAVDWTELDP